jgi:hypothetical protein
MIISGGLSTMATKNLKIHSADLLNQLKKKMRTDSDPDLAALLGIRPSVLSTWRNKNSLITSLQVANMLVKARNAAKKQVHSSAIKPIVEFFPIVPVETSNRSKKKFTVFSEQDDVGNHRKELRNQLLSAKSGLYIFYDSRGRALYAGQTKKQNIWKEMNQAFNRDRSEQVITLVKHPVKDVKFRPAHEKIRQPVDHQLKLHDLAAYFSAYEVISEMVDNLEALLVRAFPNDLLNFKMEKFKKEPQKRKKQGKK